MGKVFGKIIPAILLLLLVAAILAIFIGLPADPDEIQFTPEEITQAKELGVEIAAMMGQASISLENCLRIQEQIPSYVDRITPLTEKLFLLDPKYLDNDDSRSVSDLSIGLQWVQLKCEDFSKASKL